MTTSRPRRLSLLAAAAGGLASTAVFLVGASPPAHAASATQLRIDDEIVVEGNSGFQTVNVPITLSAPLAFDLSVGFRTTNLTATAGSDYAAKSGVVKIPAGSTTTSIQVVVYGDASAEGDESFRVQLTGTNQPAVDLYFPWSHVTIYNDDPASGRQLSIAPSYATEGNSGTTTARSIVTLSEPSATDLRVSYATHTDAGGATAGVDYKDKSGVLVIKAGATTGTILTTIVGDSEAEGGEQYSVDVTALSDPSYSVATPHGYVTIVEDDEAASDNLVTNVTVSANASAGAVDVSWSAPAKPNPLYPSYGIYGYELTYTAEDGITGGSMNVIGGTTTASISGLPLGTVRVQVAPMYYDLTKPGSGFTWYPSGWSRPFTMTVGTPSNLQATRDPAEGTVDLSWSAPTSSTWPTAYYAIEISNDKGKTWGLAGTTSTTVASVSGVSTGTTMFRVLASDGPHTGAPSGNASFSAYIGKATNVQATKHAGASDSVDLTWTEAPATWSAATYYVEYSTDGGTTWIGYGDVMSGGAATVSSLPAGSYRFRLTPGNSTGVGPASAKSNAVTL